MVNNVIMPKQGLQMTEGVIIKWYYSEGETVKAGTPLFSMETDKLTIDIDLWIVFCWALPASVVVALVFDSVWNRSKLLFFLISVLIWSVLICLALQFFNYNIC